MKGENYMQSISHDPNFKKMKSKRRWFQNVKLMGELGEGTSLYIEDYAYTYLVQYAKADLSYERSAVLIGEHYLESGQIVIYGVIDIPLDLLEISGRWVSKKALEKIEKIKEYYFPKGQYVGWMHTQPGYGIMTTTQELDVHKDIFGELGVLLLMDPIHDEKVFFAYEDGGLVQKQGFCLYYEKNDLMQKYMIDYPVKKKENSEEEGEQDSVVSNFRELGARRKKEVVRKRKRNAWLSATVAMLSLTGIFLTGIYNQQRKIKNLEKDIVVMYQQNNEMESGLNNNLVEVVFTPAEQEAEVLDEPHKIPKLSESAKKEVDEGEIEVETALAPEMEYDIHAVKTGDSLLEISYQHYQTVKMAKEIAELNELKNQDTIYIGQRLKLPKVRR